MISLCMIVRDEEKVLARCLESVKGVADELIVVDTGSRDGTMEIAKTFTDKVYSLDWRDDFAYARNAAFWYATGEYLLWLDADDVVEDCDGDALRRMLKEERPDMVYCPYLFGELAYERERFLRREGGFSFVGRVHEAVPPRGKIVKFPFRVRHLQEKKERSRRNLDIYLKWAEEEPLSPRDLFYFGRELFYHRLYTQAVAVLEEMLASDGWYVNKIAACETLSRCFEALGKEQKALDALFQSFRYGEPRALVLCRIGKLFFRQKNYAQAAFWYESALRCRDHSGEGDFEEPACRGIIPLLQLVVCYYHLGEREKALSCHRKTEALAPAHPSVIFNHAFFAEKGQTVGPVSLSSSPISR